MSRNPVLLAAVSLALAGTVLAQTAPPPDAARNALMQANIAERDREIKMMHIAQMRNCATPLLPGARGYEAVASCDPANFDESKANPYPNYPDPLTFADGTRVATAEQWARRRIELLDLFSREVFGLVPKNMPAVAWRVDSTQHEIVSGVPVITTRLTGHVDNSIDPAITVDMKLGIMVPEASAGKHVPAIMTIGALGPAVPVARPGQPAAQPVAPGSPAAMNAGPDFREQILSRGWALVGIDNGSVQPDNGAGLNAGIVGLMNKGKPRGPQDWGALRAWAWGASRALDYLETDSDIDARRVGIMGHSRNGKAALATMAYDTRFAIGFISSSGAGGAAPYRRNYGETVANIENATLFHWMAPNFLKYASTKMTTNDIPVETNELIALVAPRPLFFGGGAHILGEYAGGLAGDAWVDPPGTFMAVVKASPVYELLGHKGIGTEVLPPTFTLVGSGDLAFRRHDQGHTPNPNWPYFLAYAQRYFKS